MEPYQPENERVEYHIHIDGYIVGGNPRTNQIRCSGISTRCKYIYAFNYDDQIFYHLGYGQVSKMRIYCNYHKEITPQIKEKIIEAILNCGKCIVVE
jgi:hypothetical protein